MKKLLFIGCLIGIVSCQAPELVEEKATITYVRLEIVNIDNSIEYSNVTSAR